MKILVFGIFTLALAAACTSPKGASGTAEAPAPPPAPEVFTAAEGTLPGTRVIGGTPPPRAVVYRTNGDYADCVPINVGDGRILSYPAPSDVRGEEPIPVADGYLLDRRGVGPNTVFTRYTYAQYGALAQAPSADSLLAAVIPGSAVTASIVLPMSVQQAVADTAAVNAYIREHR